MIGEYYWKMLKGEMLSEPETHGPQYEEFQLDPGPFRTHLEARGSLFEYYIKFKKMYDRNSCEEFILIEVFSDLKKEKL